jgi:hypothetical protein
MGGHDDGRPAGARRQMEDRHICQLFGAKEALRFSELERRCEGVNQKMLIQQLKELEKDGIAHTPPSAAPEGRRYRSHRSAVFRCRLAGAASIR